MFLPDIFLKEKKKKKHVDILLDFFFKKKKIGLLFSGRRMEQTN